MHTKYLSLGQSRGLEWNSMNVQFDLNELRAIMILCTWEEKTSVVSLRFKAWKIAAELFEIFLPQEEVEKVPESLSFFVWSGKF